MKDAVRVAAIHAETKPGRTADNLELLRGWARRAAEEGVDLALFPELAITGFIPNHPVGDHAEWLRGALLAARRMAEPADGAAARALVEIARETGVRLAAGMLEDAGNVLYNALLLAGPERVEGCWRKLHIPMFEMPFYIGGPPPVVAETAMGRIGGNICFDALIPESARLLAVQNVEIVLFPFAADPPPATPASWAAWAGPPLRARCAENGFFGIACNYSGHVACAGAEQTFPGGSMVIGPRGEVVAENVSGDAMLIATLEADVLLASRADPDALFRFRRPGIYGPLVQ